MGLEDYDTDDEYADAEINNSGDHAAEGSDVWAWGEAKSLTYDSESRTDAETTCGGDGSGGGDGPELPDDETSDGAWEPLDWLE